MSTGSQKRQRSNIAPPPGQVARVLSYFRRRDVLVRIGLCFLAAVLMWCMTGAWAPPFPYRVRFAPPREIVPRVSFSVLDLRKTEDAKEKARSEVVWYYKNDARLLDEKVAALLQSITTVVDSASFDDLDRSVWNSFMEPDELATMDDQNAREAYTRFRAVLSDEENLKRVQRAVQLALDNHRRNGLLEDLGHKEGEGLLTEINVITQGDPKSARRVDVAQVRIRDVTDQLKDRISEEVKAAQLPGDSGGELAGRLFNWLRRNLPTTLTVDESATKAAVEKAVKAVKPVMTKFETGEPIQGIEAGVPLTEDDIQLLRAEHLAFVSHMSGWDRLMHSLADLGMFAALYTLCGLYVYHRERRLIKDIRRFCTLLGLVVGTIALMRLIPGQRLAEITPIVMFAMTVSIAYRHELSLLLAASVALIASFSFGLGLGGAVILVATASVAGFLSVEVRSRTKLIYVGLCAGVVSSLTTLGVMTLSGQPLSWDLLFDAGLNGIWAVVASLLMTALLPFVEKLFDVQTGISLLELADAAHPLLQELVRRAPGTYNHSINVASIAEAAADSIGANGLLVRVGAYFHDIGKMLKPGYFIENQEGGYNRHESLVPAMSTLVIIAHVKDGVELARKHHLPQSLINFIEQHHGTTLVEYFYREAARKSQEDPDGGVVDESTFRYPGPKPQTREAGVMMLADASESASRTLVEPTPARIKSLVEDITMKRLMDGQFDECGLTLRELHTVRSSLVKSLTAVYHGRVKYPDQQTA